MSLRTIGDASPDHRSPPLIKATANPTDPLVAAEARMVAQAIAAGLTLDAFQDAVIREHLPPLWMAPLGGLREPQTHIRPYLWRWQQVRQRMLQAGELIPLGSSGAGRRGLLLANPGAPPHRPAAPTHTLFAPAPP